jgi:methionine sulfoxide reductase catalytic subunit
MLIGKRKRSDVLSSEITPEAIYHDRRRFMAEAGALALAVGLPSSALALQKPVSPVTSNAPLWLQQKIGTAKETAWGAGETPAPYSAVTGYNNFYEFGYDKTDPAAYSKGFKTDPWSVTMGGMCENPGVRTLEDIIKSVDLEERIYRLRCVEAWSMVIPWIGFSLADLIKQAKPLSSARYVAFETLNDPKQMPGQSSRFSTIEWPYREGLRMDEAMHPLTLMAVGLYGEVLPNQNGAPLRLVVPWKYGFKSIKSIVAIHFTDKMPATSWNQTAPQEYGFYANVNPAVDHPRWSQATERRLPAGLFSANRMNTMPFNGYGDEVASLYSGMDLARNY